jgi:hypothetical protein
LIVVSQLINPPSPKIHEKSFDGMKGGHFDHADVVGATNIACAAKVAWPEVSEQRLTAPRSTATSSTYKAQAFRWSG